MKESLGISMIINPEMATAAEIARLLRFPSAIKIDPFAKGKVELLKFRLKPEFRLDGKSIVEINMKGKHNILVAGVERGEQVFIPNGDFEFRAGDTVAIASECRNAIDFFRRSTSSRTASAMPFSLAAVRFPFTSQRFSSSRASV